MLDLEKEDSCCLLSNLMEEAESSWKAVLKRETIASLSEEMRAERFKDKIAVLEEWVSNKMVI